MNHWVLFKKDRLFLVKYLLAHIVLAGAALIVLLKTTDLSRLTELHLSWPHALLVIPGLIVAVQIPVLIHNCVHRNLRPKWLNFVAGEIAGFYVLLSMASFELNHVMHHSHPDSDLDPHNPYQKNFIKFFFANNFGGTDVVLHKYLQYHGNTGANKALFALIVFLHFINVPLRLALWFVVLGPTLFVAFFIPSYLFHMFVFAHINYVTHETKADGSIELYNLDSNLYYKFVNFFGSGVYYHKNHHANPGHYNPKLGRSTSWLFR